MTFQKYFINGIIQYVTFRFFFFFFTQHNKLCTSSLVFFFIVKQCSVVCKYHSCLSIHSPVGRYLSWYQLLLLPIKMLWTFMYMFLCLLPWDKYPRVQWLASYGNWIFHFVRNSQIVFQSGCTMLHFYQQCMSDQFHHILISIWCCHYFILLFWTGG